MPPTYGAFPVSDSEECRRDGRVDLTSLFNKPALAAMQTAGKEYTKDG
jgi:hypothetical protein